MRGHAPDALACRSHGRPPPARPLRPARRVAARGRRAGLRRGRALPPHVHDAAALLGRDAPAGARALARGDELEPAPAGEHERAGPRRVHVRGAPPAGRHLQGATRSSWARRPSSSAATGSATSRRGRPARRPPAGAGGSTTAPGTLAVLLASTSDLDDLIPTLVAYQIEWNKLHALARATERPAGAEPDPADCAEGFGGAVDDWMRVRDAWDGSLSDFLDEVSSPAAEPAHPHAQRQPGRLRAHDAPLDGADPRGDGRRRASPTARSTSSPPTRTRS